MEKRKKIRNPFDSSENKCFACSEANPIGLKLKFEESEKYFYTLWLPTENYQGYGNVVHGGIIATILDEAGVYCTYVKAETACVTKDLSIKYIKPVFITRGEITVRSEVINISERDATVRSWLYDRNNVLCVQSEATYFLYPPDIAKKRFHYPGKDAFYYG